MVLTVAMYAQQISGSISGTVKDNQQAVIAGARVILTNTAQAVSREATTGSDGSFLFTPLQPATYRITVESAGFKKFEQTEIKIFASDRIALPNIVLELGAVSETVTVEAHAVALQTRSAERAGVLTGNQVVNLAVRSRNFLDLAATVPGVIYTGGLGGIFANGSRGNQNNLTVDGITNVDTGSNGGVLATLNIDQIAEFKLITNSQPAEIGRSSGAAIQVVTRSGTRDFHGTGYIFHRHEGLNANNWRNNQENRARQLFRYNYFGYNIGGPVILPGGFNRNRDKLFFFFSQEFQTQLSPNSLRNVLLPTALERNGDFSRSVESNGAPLVIRNPLNNGTPYPGNIIPANQISADGKKILSFYPTPNAPGDPTFNHQTQVSDKFPRREQLFRMDYNINDKWRLYGRYIWTKSEQDRAYGQWNADYNVPYAPMNFGTPGWSFITNLTTIINPTLTNEFIFGSSKNVLNIDPVDDTFKRDKLGLNYTMPFPKADPLGLIQNWRYNVSNAPFTAFNGTPFRNFNHTWDFTDNVSKVMGAHAFKAGLYVHRSWKDQTAFTSVNGNIWFDRDAQNPGDTNWAFSNALIGNYQRLQQSNQVLNGQYRNWNVEWYVQDNWKIRSNLNLDIGVRFYWIEPQYDQALQTSSFNSALYNGANQAVLLQPYRNASGTIVARNPVTGQESPRALIGSLFNNGRGYVNGLYANGMGLSGATDYPRGLIDSRGLHYAPRVGLAYTVTPKTVIRTGGGVFYDRFQGNPVFDMLPNPPSTASPTLYYGNLSTIASTAGVYFPANVRGFSKEGKVPTTYNWNFTIQRELPAGIMFDVAYVGARSLHNLNIFNFNHAPFGSAWLPENQDPTIAAPTFDGRTTKPVNLYLPYLGYGNTNVTAFGASSNYHALQASANRRLARGMQFGLAYTWSKVMGTAGGDGDGFHPTNARAANYGPLGYDVTHLFVANFTYDLPAAGRGGNFLDNVVGKAIFNNWAVSGVTTMATGMPDNIGFGVQGLGGAEVNRRWTGSETYGPRVVITGTPQSGSGTPTSWINTSAFALPPIGKSNGLESASRPIRKPGINNFDISIFKEVPLGAEGRFLQLRLEMFNAFNHTQFSDFNRTATFNLQGVLTNLPTAVGGGGGRYGFGAITAARDPRLIQLAAKFYF
ncbi:MAG: carboxypeptidase regulatory-like domain-containing protein [Acidobacteriia bacterium]|nr:carboxypeptidase regulatory-like domain-containing protein [Terriglobia bacterium]